MAKYLVATRGCTNVQEANTSKQVDKIVKVLSRRHKKVMVYRREK